MLIVQSGWFQLYVYHDQYRLWNRFLLSFVLLYNVLQVVAFIVPVGHFLFSFVVNSLPLPFSLCLVLLQATYFSKHKVNTLPDVTLAHVER